MPETYMEKKFISDYYRHDMLIIKIIRSQVQGGIITNISIPDLPSGCGVIQYKDIPSKKELEVFDNEMPLLCSGKIMYEGEPVLLLYGKDEKQLEEITAQIMIDYETDYTTLSFESYLEEQINKEITLNRGKTDKKFESAKQIIEERYLTYFQNHFDLEPQGAAAFKTKKGMEIVCASQWPFNVRKNVSACLGIDEKEIVISVPAMGKSHNGKLWYAGTMACYVGIVTEKTGKNSICIIPKQDAVFYTPGRAASIIKHTTGLDEKGRIIVRKINILLNSGAYPVLTEEAIKRICFAAGGAYTTQFLQIEAKSIRTNSPPAGAFNGMGFHQSFFAGESHINTIAKAAGFDPLQWRLKNSALTPDDLPISGNSKKLLHLEKLLLTVAEKSDFKRKHAAYSLSAKKQSLFSGKRRGIGLALACQGNGFIGKPENKDKYSVTVRLEKDGRATIFTSAGSENFQTTNIWQDLAGNILEIDSTDVKIENRITSLVPDSGPSLFSSNITIVTQLVERCCNAIKKSRFRHPLPIEVKRSYKLSQNGWDPEDIKGNPFSVLSWGAAIVETETDPITLDSTVRGVWFAADCGKILNIDLARAEVESEIIRSMAGSTISLQGQSSSKNNLPLTPPHMVSHFPISIDFIKSKERKTGGIGELPDNLIPAALSEALSIALNIKIKTLPSSPVLLFRKIQHKNISGESNIEN